MSEYNLEEIWSKLIEKLKNSTSENNFTMYINQIEPLRIEKDTLIVSVTSKILKNAIEQKYYAVMIAILIEITNNSNFTMKIEVIQPNTKKGKENSSGVEQTQLNFNPEPEEIAFDSSLNKKQRFENFIVGNSNRFATAAAQAVAKDPAEIYNPLFIYGNSGLGKTHLMQAIGNEILDNNPGAKVKYVTSETFTNEIINAIQNHSVKSFQEKYRNIDCLIIDDIQFLENKERTQEEFFHTFNALKEANKQIVISSDRPPTEMDMLEERLRSRFVNGLTADIQPPDLETRIAILRNKCETDHFNMPNDVIQAIAASIDSNIRMIEGAFNRIVAWANLMGQPVDMKLAQKVLAEFGNTKKQTVTMDSIINYICSYYNIKVDDLLGKKRPKNISNPRQIAMYLCRNLTDFSLPRIGEAFGGRDHTTVIHACEKVTKLRETDDNFDRLLTQFEEQIKK